MKKPLILFGTSAFAEIAFEYFNHDSEYEVAAFTVSEAFITSRAFLGRPVVPFERVELEYPPDKFAMHIALVYQSLNRHRMRFYDEARAKGYGLANYVSRHAFVWRNVALGDNVFIFENNVVQPFVKLGRNLVLWSGNHVGHHSTIGDHCFISSHVVISGFCEIGDACFFGVNSTVGNNLKVGADCLIGAGALVARDVPAKTLIKGQLGAIDPLDTHAKFKL